MFGLGPATRVSVATGATDMRKGFDGLYGLVRDELSNDPLSGHVVLFANKTRTRLKILFRDGSGLWVCAKRLEKMRFHWPAPTESAVWHKALGRPERGLPGRADECERQLHDQDGEPQRRRAGSDKLRWTRDFRKRSLMAARAAERFRRRLRPIRMRR